METMMFVLVVAAVAITTSVYGGDSMGGDSCKGCIDRNGTCRSAGEKWEDQCSTFKCKKSKTEDGKKGWKSVVTRFGCKDRNGTCHKMRQKWKDQCSTFKCKKTKAGDGTFELKAIRVRYVRPGGNGSTEEYPDLLPADGSGIKKSRTHW